MKFDVLALFLLLLTAFDLQAEAPIIPYPENKPECRHCQIAASMVFKNESPYLKEWVEYHRLIGIEHFYLYNNLSSDNFWEVLKPYVEKGIVELFDFPETNFQTSANHFPTQTILYNHSLDLSKDANEWLAIIDSDEFICPVKCDTLKELLEKYKNYAGVCIFWQMYGTSHVKSLQLGELMIEKLVLKMHPSLYENTIFKTFKSIVRPQCVLKMLSAHIGEYRYFTPIYPDYWPFEYPIPYGEELPIDEVRINHYAWRTEDYFEAVKLPRMIEKGYAPESNIVPQSITDLMDSCNVIEDRIMDKYIPRLRIAMERQN